MKQTYVITGGAGFIGTNLVMHLVAENAEVIVVDDLSAGDRDRLPEGVTFHKLDICETEKLIKCIPKGSIVVHLAALPRVTFSIDHPLEAQRVNADGTLSVLEAARKAKATRVIFAGSSSVYGDQETLPLGENLPARPKSPYALQKYMGEHLMKLWHELHGIETVSLRFFNVYGPHMDPDGPYALVIGRFLKLRKEGKPLTITGDGTQTRDFTHVDDVVRAVMAASTNSAVGNGEVFNVGAGKDMSVNDLAALIGGPTEYIPPRIEPKHTRADVSQIKKVLGWEPKVTLEDGIVALKKESGIA